MANSLGMRVTAEGVETLAQAQLLQSMACDSVQGYYFSRPVQADHIPSLLIRRWALQDARPSGFTLLAPARV
jgi:EAL domain-containing protein (putative c-di-GMP-specific phosphodiesterase class I)